MLSLGSKVAIVCCSNAQLKSNRSKIENLLETIKEIGLIPICNDYIFEEYSVFSATGEKRAEALMKFYCDEGIEAIFDISGGDIANEVLEYLDFDIIKHNSKPFFGYSDLTTVINAIYSKTNLPAYLYQIKNLIYEHKEEQIINFINSLIYGEDDLFNIKYSFLQGNSMEGTVVGGNIRCLLKLAGTPYMPSFKEKILFLEGCGGEVAQMTTYLNQLKQMGVFKEIKGILLGTFTKMEENNVKPTMEELVINTIKNKEMPIAKTNDIGHGSNSKCIVIGKHIILNDLEKL